MTDLQAALGVAQMKKLKFLIERRRQIARLYNEQFSECGVEPLPMPPHKKSVFYRYIVMVNKLEKIRNIARKKGVMCERPVFKPLNKSLPRFKCPNSDKAYEHALSVPLYPSLSEDEIQYLLKTLTAIFRHAT
jgi:dTDP-4-amino-4,6-dideoxygalactose transaminase